MESRTLTRRVTARMLKGAFKRRLPRVAAPTFSILGIFWMLSTIFGASGLGRKQSEQAQFSNLFSERLIWVHKWDRLSYQY